MVSHFKQKPAFIKENAVFLYLSPTVEGIYVSTTPKITPSILSLTIYRFIMDFFDSYFLFAYMRLTDPTQV